MPRAKQGGLGHVPLGKSIVKPTPCSQAARGSKNVDELTAVQEMAQDEHMQIQAENQIGAEDDDADATVAEDADSATLQ